MATSDQLALFEPDPTLPEAAWDVIYAYSRAQALADGVLVDVTATAQEAGFVWPVAVTAAVWAIIEAIPRRYQGWQSVAGRLWDVLWMAHLAIRRAPAGGAELLYTLILHHARKTYLTLKLVVGPGDQGEPVVTLMLPEED